MEWKVYKLTQSFGQWVWDIIAQVIAENEISALDEARKIPGLKYNTLKAERR